MRAFMRHYKLWLGLAALVALFGCAEQRKFWKEVDQADQSAKLNSDYGAGKKP